MRSAQRANGPRCCTGTAATSFTFTLATSVPNTRRRQRSSSTPSRTSASCWRRRGRPPIWLHATLLNLWRHTHRDAKPLTIGRDRAVALGRADCRMSSSRAGVTQLAECQLPKLNVAGSNPVSRSTSSCSTPSAGPDDIAAPRSRPPFGAIGQRGLSWRRSATRTSLFRNEPLLGRRTCLVRKSVSPTLLTATTL